MKKLRNNNIFEAKSILAFKEPDRPEDKNRVIIVAQVIGIKDEYERFICLCTDGEHVLCLDNFLYRKVYGSWHTFSRHKTNECFIQISIAIPNSAIEICY